MPDRHGFCFSVAPACENVPLVGGPWARVDRLFPVRCHGWRTRQTGSAISGDWTCCPHFLSSE